MEEKIKVYIKINDKNEITEIGSSIFIRDVSDWIQIAEGFGDRYAHAQSQYLEKPLTDIDGNYNYKYENNQVVKKPETLG